MIKINKELLDKTSANARGSLRKRMNHNFHSELMDRLQRLLNAMEPDTYVQPHKHQESDKREVFILLTGKAVVVEFDNQGTISDHIILDVSSGNYGAEISPGIYHTIISLASGTVVYEVKDGPYTPLNDKNFASWSPEEGSPECKAYNSELLSRLKLFRVVK